MGRFRIGKEVDDFVKSFHIGSDIGHKSRYYDYLSKKGEAAEGLQNAIAQGARDAAWRNGNTAVPTGGGVDHGQGSVTLQSYDPSKAPSYLGELNQKYNLPSNYLTKTAWIESKFDPNAKAGSSSAGGLFQFINDTANRIGLTNKYSGQDSAEAAAKLAVENRDLLSKGLGRDPTGAELYLAHQQGGQGALDLLKNPDARAVDIVGAKAVRNNGGSANMTAGQFANLWTHKFDNLVSEKTASDVTDAPPPKKAVIEQSDVAPLPPAAVPASIRNQDAGMAAPQNTAEADIPEDMPLQYGSRGGMIHRYANGGAVVRGAVPAYQYGGPVDEDADPTDGDDLPISRASYTEPEGATQAGNFFDVLPSALKGGLQGLQDMFGLNQQQGAVPQANNDFMGGVKAMFSGEGAATPQEMQLIKSKVDPEGKLDASMTTIAGLTAGYEHLLKQGDEVGARKLAASIIQYSHLKSSELGALASEAVQRGDEGTAVKALIGAYNAIPNGKEASVQDGNVVVTDQKTGRPIEQFKLTPQILMQAAKGLTDGNEFYNQLMATASGKVASAPAENDPAYDAYVNSLNKPESASPSSTTPSSAPNSAVPATSTPGSNPSGSTSAAVQPASFQSSVDEEGLPVQKQDQFVPTTPAPALKEIPAAPDFAHMSKANGTRVLRDYNAKKAEIQAYNTAETKKYNEAVKAEHEAWRMRKADEARDLANTNNTTRQRRASEAREIPNAYDEWSTNLKGSAPPPDLAKNIKNIGQHLVEGNNLHASEGIGYATEITNPSSKVVVKQHDKGGTVTMSDGETLHLTPRAFKEVKRIRDGFDDIAKKKAEEANRPSALGQIGEGISGWASHTAKRWGDVGRTLGMTPRQAVSLDQER